MEPNEVMYCDECSEPSEPSSTQTESTSRSKPVIIGLYGVPGAGKTFWLDKLGKVLSKDDFAFYDGSDVIAVVTPGGLEAFQKLTEEAKTDYRERAISRVKEECCDTRKSAIVAGHFMFWTEGDEGGQFVCTPADLATYTHILYLDVAAETIAEHRMNDDQRSRPSVSVSHLVKWLRFEKRQLRHLCRCHNILFTPVSHPLASVNKLSSLIQDFRTHSEAYNMDLVKQKMDDILATSFTSETVIVLDGDKTLAQEDSGVLFWEQVRANTTEGGNVMKALFSSPLGYSYTAFRQATLLYEEAVGEEDFEACCQAVSSMINMHRDIVNLLHLVRGARHVRAVVVTCGLRSVWEKVLQREGLSRTVKVIGGGRLCDNFVRQCCSFSSHRRNSRFHLCAYI